MSDISLLRTHLFKCNRIAKDLNDGARPGKGAQVQKALGWEEEHGQDEEGEEGSST